MVQHVRYSREPPMHSCLRLYWDTLNHNDKNNSLIGSLVKLCMLCIANIFAVYPNPLEEEDEQDNTILTDDGIKGGRPKKRREDDLWKPQGEIAFQSMCYII